MRMYSPEWEAVKELQFTPRVLDLQYDISAGEIPADHGPALYQEILRHLPWLADIPFVGPALFLAVPGYVTSGLSLGGDVGLEQLLGEGYLLGAGPLLAQLEPKTLETFKARVVTAEQLIGEGQWTFLESLLSTLT